MKKLVIVLIIICAGQISIAQCVDTIMFEHPNVPILKSDLMFLRSLGSTRLDSLKFFFDSNFMDQTVRISQNGNELVTQKITRENGDFVCFMYSIPKTKNDKKDTIELMIVNGCKVIFEADEIYHSAYIMYFSERGFHIKLTKRMVFMKNEYEYAF